MPSLEREFLFTSGKGGVGKSTVTVALARALSAGGRRVLVGLMDVGVGARLLGLRTLASGSMERCDENLWATLIEPEAAIAEYGTMILKSPTAYRALLENRYARSFFAAVPGLHQWAVLGKAWYHSQERRPDGSKRFDTVILDAPATGHGLEMLRVPKLILEVAPAGVLRRDAELAWRTLTNPGRSGVVVVGIPEELAVSETLELASEIAALNIPLASVVLNAVQPRLFGGPQPQFEFSADENALANARRQRSHAGEALIDIAAERLIREKTEARQRARLSSFEDRLIALDWVEKAATVEGSKPLVEALAKALASA